MISLLSIFFMIISFIFCSGETTTCLKPSYPSGPYLGQKPPGLTPEVFAPGIISTEAPEQCIGFLPGGRELYFVRKIGDYRAILSMKEENGRWTTPRVAPFSGKYDDAEFSLSHNGRKLAFISLRPLDQRGQPIRFWDIWIVDKTPRGWSEPKNPGSVINSDRRDVFPAFSPSGDLYFASDRDGDYDIYVSKYMDGRYMQAERLDGAVNSKYEEWDQAIAPDDSYMIFCSIGRHDSHGGSDLYVSFRKKDGSWTIAQNMGAKINTRSGVCCPCISPDGRYLFFESSITGKGDIYWVDSRIIEELKPKELI